MVKIGPEMIDNCSFDFEEGDRSTENPSLFTIIIIITITHPSSVIQA